MGNYMPNGQKMEPFQEGKREKRKTLELEKDIMGIIDELKGKAPAANFEKFMVERDQRFFDEQEDE